MKQTRGTVLKQTENQLWVIECLDGVTRYLLPKECDVPVGVGMTVKLINKSPIQEQWRVVAEIK